MVLENFLQGQKKWKIISNMTALSVFDSLQNGALTFEAIWMKYK